MDHVIHAQNERSHTSSSPKECLRLCLDLSGMLDDMEFLVETKISLVNR